MADVKLLQIKSPFPEPGTPEYEVWEREMMEKPPFLMPDGPYERTGAQNWLEPASRVVRTPETVMIEVKHELFPLLDGKLPIGWNELLEELDAAAERVDGYPVFFRSGQTSAKHFGLDKCIVTNRGEFENRVTSLVERSYMGFPDQSYRYLLVRRLIPTKPVFTAYMPITREFRIFLEGGKVSHIQPYWPEEAMTGFDGKKPDDADWRKKLMDISKMTQAEKDYLAGETLKIADACPGDWSVDWLQDRDGNWWMTDMADACVSFRWEPDFCIVK